MRIGDIIILAVWTAVLAGALSSGLVIGHTTGPAGSQVPFPPVAAGIFILIFFFLASSGGVFFLRRRIFLGGGWTTRLIDHVWGQGTWMTFVVRLRPTALMIAMCFTLGLVGFAPTYMRSQSRTAYFNCTFALTVGFGLFVAHSLSRKYPPRLP